MSLLRILFLEGIHGLQGFLGFRRWVEELWMKENCDLCKSKSWPLTTEDRMSPS